MVESSRVKITSFEQLLVWQGAQDIAVNVYKVTKKFPNDERFGLTDQIRRAASLISANIAEGFGRHSIKDKSHFYTIAHGSLLETKSHLYLAQKLGYIEQLMLDQLCEKIVINQKMLNALIRSMR